MKQGVALRHKHIQSPDLKMFELAVQPPPQTRPGVVLYPPIVARLSSDASIFEELSQIWAVASLISPNGESLDQQLGGRVADSAHPMAGNGVNGRGGSQGAITDRAYFYFPNLIIHTPGRYRVRVTLMRMNNPRGSSSEDDVRYDEHVDSHSIVVEDGAFTHARASEFERSPVVSCSVLIVSDSRERAFLRMLRDDGQEVPSSPA